MAADGVGRELSRRIAAIDGRRTGRAELAREVDAIRSIAHRAGLHPVATVAHLLDGALSRGERGPLVEGWLALLGDAAASGRSDREACAAYAAACAVRIS